MKQMAAFLVLEVRFFQRVRFFLGSGSGSCSSFETVPKSNSLKQFIEPYIIQIARTNHSAIFKV